MEFPFVVELLEYWAEYPPSHLILRAMAGIEGKGKKKKNRGNWPSRRQQRAEELDDSLYEPERDEPDATAEDMRIASQFITGARHRDCAPPHIQQAIERSKLGKHMEIPKG